MLDSIMGMVKDQVGGKLTDQLGLTDDQVDGTMSAAGETVGEVMSSNKEGGMDGLMDLFSAGDNNSSGNGMMDQMGGKLVTNLCSKVGLSSSVANSVKDMVLPAIIKAVTDKVGGSEGGLMGMLGSSGILGGGGGGSITDKIGGMFGK